jgi:arabinogalactan endo-1,4-beta-galactosidase
MHKIIKIVVGVCLFPIMMQAQQKYVGGDISLLPTYEEHGVHYLDQDGKQVEPLKYFGEKARWNAMRVRVFVDPSKASDAHKDEGVRQDLYYATALCKRIKDEGYALMLDFHYSDTWTDPGKHSTPSAWDSDDPNVLADSVYQYTVRSLQYMKENGVVPDFIQPGNEITNGMMWPTGHCLPDGRSYGGGTFANFVKYLKAGVKGCKEVCPEAKIVIHTELSTEWGVTNFYNTLGEQVDYDIIGLSYYPDYHGTLSTLSSTLNTLESKHGDKNIMIVETGYGAQWSLNGKYSSTVQKTWPLSEVGQKKFTNDLINELNKHPKVTGLFWWMPEDNEYWADANPARSSWWNASLYTQNTGKPLAAMFELQRFIGLDPTGIVLPSISSPAERPTSSFTSFFYNLQGQRLSPTVPNHRGIYIKNGKKFVVR